MDVTSAAGNHQRISALYAKAFFDLQLQFAQKVAEITAFPLARTLLEYTTLYIRFGLGRDFQPLHPVWQEYLAGLHIACDIQEWTYRFYVRQANTITSPPVAATSGCFSYGLLPTDRIRLHFRNVDTENGSSLDRVFLAQRHRELTDLFRHVQQHCPAQTRVAGVSWLYNLEAYRRLFPPAYIATARIVTDRFRFMPLWGQFLDRYGNVKESMASVFLQRLNRQEDMQNLHMCFPLQVIAVEAPVQEFYEFYGIEVYHTPTITIR